MIKKIIDWILGKNEKPAEPVAPYKVEVVTPAVEETVPLVQLEQVAAEPVVAQVPASAIEVAPVTVKAKFKKAELAKLSKKELVDLAAKNGVEVKARSTKEVIIKSLLKA